MSIWELANPNRFIRVSGKIIPFTGISAIFLLILGLSWGFFFTPDDYRQGSTVKIIFIHVPSAFLAINIYFMMFVASVIWLVRRHHVSALAAKAAAPIGISMTLIAIITGAIWGQPMWGTYWVWDPRLTSFSIMLLFYIGYISLWNAIDNKDKAADLTSILCLVGSIFAILSRYAVFFWNQGLHQGASLSLDKEEHVADVFFIPLVISIAGFVFVFASLLLMRTQTEIRNRRIQSLTAIERDSS
jgi:heme exporter protein C